MFNNLDHVDFTTLLANTISFDPPLLDDDELYVPSSYPSSSSKSSSPFPSDFVIFSQNARRSNSAVHAILSIASSMKPPADLVLIQEPYFGRIGVDPRMAQGNPITEVFGCPKHIDWQAIIPPLSPTDDRPDVIAYVPSQRSLWTFQPRTDIISHRSLLCLEINSSSHPFIVFNVYNDTDNGACDAIATLPGSLDRSIFIGDFNLHHPVWSQDSNLDKHSSKADRLVELFANQGFGILNEPGVETFSVFRDLGNGPELYTSTLDLAWASKELQPFVQDFCVAKHLSSNSDHFPLTIRLSYAPSQPRQRFVFSGERFEDWAKSFVVPDIPETISTVEGFMSSVDTLQNATLTACQVACSWKPKGPRAARWFDSKVRKALTDLRRSRKRLHARKDRHNAIRHGVALRQFQYTVIVAKRSHARAFAASVKPGTNLWRLTSWYQGVRKTTVPTLKDPSNTDARFPTWVSASPAKAKLLAESWFPNNAPKAENIPYPFPPLPTREFKSITNEEVLDTLRECASDNAPGISGVTYRVWKWVAQVAPDQLVSVVRASIKLQTHHPSWKQALVAVIPKNNKTLGTRTKIPTRHMLDTLGVQTTSDSNVPSGQKLGLLKMYP